MTTKIDKALNDYFEVHYAAYDDIIDLFVTPIPYMWKFNIPPRRMTVRLSCDPETFEVTETRTPMYSMINDNYIRYLWRNLEDIPFDGETETILEGYYIWDAGTDRDEIWHWFDEHYSKGVYALLYGEED